MYEPVYGAESRSDNMSSLPIILNLESRRAHHLQQRSPGRVKNPACTLLMQE